MSDFHQKFREHYAMRENPSTDELELFEKTQKYSRFVSWIPGLRMIAICNTISMYCSDADSDIDLFVVADEKRMWFVRILMTAIFHILGVRRYGNKVAKRFCLSFFSTTKGLDFNSFRLEHDIYLAYWIYYLKPIVDKGDTYKLLRKLNENWTGEFFSPDEHDKDEKRYVASSWACRRISMLSKFWDITDTLLKKMFFKKSLIHTLSKKILHLAPSDRDIKTPSGIIINDDMLKFHNNDVREDIKKTLM